MKIIPIFAKKGNLIEPSKKPGTMSLWHGGNLDSIQDDFIRQKKGHWEFGPGLYLTTKYEVAIKYAKGSRRLYMVTVEKGNDAAHSQLDWTVAQKFALENVKRKNLKESLLRMEKRVSNGKIDADTFLNMMSDVEVSSNKSLELRQFIVENNVDYWIVTNAFGWGETMIVLFNMNKIVSTTVVRSGDEIVQFDLPKEFN